MKTLDVEIDEHDDNGAFDEVNSGFARGRGGCDEFFVFIFSIIYTKTGHKLI